MDKQILNSIPNVSIRLDRKQLIKELQAMNDSYIELWINTKNLSTIQIKDRYKIITTKTRN